MARLAADFDFVELIVSFDELGPDDHLPAIIRRAEPRLTRRAT
jgi:hypothetical protein